MSCTNEIKTSEAEGRLTGNCATLTEQRGKLANLCSGRDLSADGFDDQLEFFALNEALLS